MINTINEIFQFPLLFQVTFGSIYMCIAEFIALTSEDTSVIAQFVIALYNQMFRFYLFCRVGEDTCENV